MAHAALVGGGAPVAHVDQQVVERLLCALKNGTFYGAATSTSSGQSGSSCALHAHGRQCPLYFPSALQSGYYPDDDEKGIAPTGRLAGAPVEACPHSLPAAMLLTHSKPGPNQRRHLSCHCTCAPPSALSGSAHPRAVAPVALHPLLSSPPALKPLLLKTGYLNSQLPPLKVTIATRDFQEADRCVARGRNGICKCKSMCPPRQRRFARPEGLSSGCSIQQTDTFVGMPSTSWRDAKECSVHVTR